MGALDTALLAAIRAGGANKGRSYLVGHFTADNTLSPQDCYGGVVTNQGDAGAQVQTLPLAQVGMEVTFIVMAAQVLSVDPNANDKINVNGVLDATAGDAISADAIGEFVTLECLEAGVWTATSQAGTWTAA